MSARCIPANGRSPGLRIIPQVAAMLLCIGSMCPFNARAAELSPLDLSLFVAVQRGDIEETRKLISEGASVRAENKKGWAPLVIAAKAGNLKLVKLIVENGGVVNGTTAAKNGSTIFTFAVDNGSVEVMDYLLERGAEINGKGKDGLMPIVYAASQGRLETVKYLLSKGADPEEYGPVDSKGVTFNALVAAARNEHVETFKVMFDHRPIDLERTNSSGETLLLACSKKSPPEIVKLLLKSGANVDASRPDGHTALICASYNGQLATVKILLAYGADPFVTASHGPDAKDQHRCDAAEHALENGHIEIHELITKAKNKRVEA